MKNIEITYDAGIWETPYDYEEGEAAYVLPMNDELADAMLRRGWTDGQYGAVENTLYWIEQMRGRIYVRGSIKSIREAK